MSVHQVEEYYVYAKLATSKCELERFLDSCDGMSWSDYDISGFDGEVDVTLNGYFDTDEAADDYKELIINFKEIR